MRVKEWWFDCENVALMDSSGFVVHAINIIIIILIMILYDVINLQELRHLEFNAAG